MHNSGDTKVASLNGLQVNKESFIIAVNLCFSNFYVYAHPNTTKYIQREQVFLIDI